MSFLLLLVAFVLTGFNQVSNKALIAFHLDGYRGLYAVGFWGTGVILGLLTLAITKHKVTKQEALIGSVMGISGSIAMVLLLLALRTVPAVVAFPVRSCGNTALTAVVSYLAWREQVTRKQWLGIACGLAAIYLLL